MMPTRCSMVAALSLAAAIGTAVAQSRAAEQELLVNPGFAAPGKQDLPDAWSLAMPAVKSACCRVRAVQGGLRVEAAGEPYSVGVVCQDLKNVRGGKAYAIQAACTAKDLPSPYRAVMVRVVWLRQGKPTEPSGSGMLVRGPTASGDRLAFYDVLAAPPEADGLRLSLEVKWPERGTVVWQRASVRECPAPPPRKVKIGTVYLKPSRTTPERNLELFCQQVDAAGQLKLDIVCLPEAITMIGTGRNAAECAEAIPGPSCQRLGEAARRNRIWVVAGLYERDAQRVYNTAVLLDRQGRLAGKYRKVHLSTTESPA